MLLALDSALGHGSAALYKDGACVAAHDIAEQGAQARLLVPTIEAVLADVGINYSNLTQIACSVGPGGFTGIRIALATARALAYTLGVQVIGINTLACLAYRYQQTERTRVTALLPAGKGMVYAQSFDAHGKAVTSPEMREVRDFTRDDQVVTSSVSEIYGAEHLALHQVMLDARLVGMIASDENARHLLTEATPLYIRPPDITMPKAAY